MATLYERIGNIHIHTTYSDGNAHPEEVVAIANRTGLDYILLADHLVYPATYRGWYGSTLLLVGQEIHDPASPHVNHYLAFGTGEDLASYGQAPQRLIDAVRAREGLGFIAHPYEHSGAFANEPEIDWTAWEVEGFTGLEIWNYMSEFKAYTTTLLHSLLYAFFPKLAITGPFRETLAKWDALLTTQHIVGIGGSDAHATTYHLGPLSRQIFPYAHLFRSVNTHLLIPVPWSGDAALDAQLVYDALHRGRAFVAYDGLSPARGFAFTGECDGSTYTMGDEIITRNKVRFDVRVPARAHLCLIHNGVVAAETWGTALSYHGHTPGFYRVEAYRSYACKERGWIFSNPIYVRAEPNPSIS